MKKTLMLCLAALLLLSACGKEPPSRRELAQTESGWDVTYMDKAEEYVPPEGITVIYGQQTGRSIPVSLRNDSGADWMYGEDWGQMQALVNGEWYVIPSDTNAGGLALTTLGYILKPGETMDASFAPGYFPPGRYRRIWNGVAIPFEILP